jgi:dolichyl-phosphate beta-glucosyltransferase
MHARTAMLGERGGALTSLIFPAYNPGPLVENTCQELGRFLGRANDLWEVVFVCDGCTDGTPERLREWARSWGEKVRIVSYEPNRGKGHAVRAGLAAARGDWRIFTDVDLAYSFDDIARLAAVLRTGADVVIASRTHPESRVVAPVRLQGYVYRRHLQSWVFSTVVRWLLPVAQRDTQAGLKGLSARTTRLVLPHLRCNGFEFDCELLTACARFGLAVTEMPICVRYDDVRSTTNWRSTLRMFRALWNIRKAWRTPPVGSAAGEEPQQKIAA